MMPGMKPTGANTAMMVAVVATTARPISSEASMADGYGALPPRMWRTMFSISTIASSTRIPMVNDSASRVIMLSDWPSGSSTAKVGISDSGMATAAISVARQSRRNSQTTITASRAPRPTASSEAI